MKRVVFLVAFFFVSLGCVLAVDQNAGLVEPDAEPLTDASGCVDTDDEDVTTAGMTFTWDDITTRDQWLFNWDSCVRGQPSKIDEIICEEGGPRIMRKDCPEGMICTSFVHFESPVLESFIATWIALMRAEGKSDADIAVEISYIRDIWQEAAACVPTEGASDIPILILPPHSLDFLHGLRVNFDSFGGFFPRDRFVGTDNRVVVEGEEMSRIIVITDNIISVRADDGRNVENTIRVKKKAAEALAQSHSSGEAGQAFQTSFKKGDITFTGRSFKVKFAGFFHKVYGLFV